MMILYFVLLMKSHLQSYPCPLQINSFWNLGFLLGITIILQIISGIFLGLHYTSDLYFSLSFFLSLDYGWSLLPNLLTLKLLFVSFFWTSFHSLSSPSLGICSREGFYLPDS